MNATGPPPFPRPWPPLRVGGTRRGVKFRDLVLTAAAWCVLAWLLKDLVRLVYDFLRAPIFELTTALPPDLAHLWSRLRSMVVLSVLLAVALLLWAVRHRHRLRATKEFPTPRPLTLAEQAEWFHVAPEAVAEARNFKITDVQFRDDDAIAAFEGREPPGLDQ